MTLTLILAFNPPGAVIVTYSHAKVQGQRSVGSEDTVETNGRTDGGDCITSLCLSNAVDNYKLVLLRPYRLTEGA